MVPAASTIAQILKGLPTFLKYLLLWTVASEGLDLGITALKGKSPEVKMQEEQLKQQKAESEATREVAKRRANVAAAQELIAKTTAGRLEQSQVRAGASELLTAPSDEGTPSLSTMMSSPVTPAMLLGF